MKKSCSSIRDQRRQIFRQRRVRVDKGKYVAPTTKWSKQASVNTHVEVHRIIDSLCEFFEVLHQVTEIEQAEGGSLAASGLLLLGELGGRLTGRPAGRQAGRQAAYLLHG